MMTCLKIEGSLKIERVINCRDHHSCSYMFLVTRKCARPSTWYQTCLNIFANYGPGPSCDDGGITVQPVLSMRH